MKNTVVCCDNNILLAFEALSDICDVFLFDGAELNNKFLIENKCDFLFVRSTVKVDENLLMNTNIKFVGTATSGSDHFNQQYLDTAGIYYCDAKGCNSNSVAEYVVYTILKWVLENNIDIKTQTIGIIGFGYIGTKVAFYAEQLGIKILINDPPLKEKEMSFPDYVQYAELDDLLKQANIITNHVPYITANSEQNIYSTHNFLNAENMCYISDNSLFIHSSRGKIVDENSLLGLIKTKNIDAVIDVWADEPDFNTELVKSSYFASPHIAGHSVQGKLNGTIMLLKEFEKFSGFKPDYTKFNNSILYKHPDKKLDFNNLAQLLKNIDSTRTLLYDNNFMKNLVNVEQDVRKREFKRYRSTYSFRSEYLHI